jgi:MFS family permease
LALNIHLYPWFQFFRSLLFWQAIWFLYFQQQLSAAEAIVLAAVYDIATTALEVPSGYASDRLGRRLTLIIAIALKIIGALLLAFGGDFFIFAIAQIFLGASMAFASGTDTSLLYESLASGKREGEIQTHEQRAWRFSFSALAISAVTGGLLAAIAPMWAFLATSLAATVALIIAMRFVEPDHTSQAVAKYNLRAQLQALREALLNRTLTWLFLLTAGMYTFSHVPFVFGQPFILEAISTAGLGLNAPIISGSVTATMMIVSVATSWLAPQLQRRFGVGRVFLIALAMQVVLIATLAITNHPAAIGLLFLRMVPDSLARPFILARIHPLLENTHRATYLSMQSFCGRLLFAVTLFASSLGATTGAALAYSDIQIILMCYALAGAALLATLVIMLPKAHIAD